MSERLNQPSTEKDTMNTERIRGHRVRCYDNDGRSADRYTVAYLDAPEHSGTVTCLSMDARPFHPQGIGMHSTCVVGRHLGRRIRFSELPEDCRRAVEQDLTHNPTAP